MTFRAGMFFAWPPPFQVPYLLGTRLRPLSLRNNWASISSCTWSPTRNARPAGGGDESVDVLSSQSRPTCSYGLKSGLHGQTLVTSMSRVAMVLAEAQSGDEDLNSVFRNKAVVGVADSGLIVSSRQHVAGVKLRFGRDGVTVPQFEQPVEDAAIRNALSLRVDSQGGPDTIGGLLGTHRISSMSSPSVCL